MLDFYNLSGHFHLTNTCSIHKRTTIYSYNDTIYYEPSGSIRWLEPFNQHEYEEIK